MNEEKEQEGDIWYPTLGVRPSTCILVFCACAKDLMPAQSSQNPIKILGRLLPHLTAIHFQCRKECRDWSQTCLNPTSSTNQLYIRCKFLLYFSFFQLAELNVAGAANCPPISILLPFVISF